MNPSDENSQNNESQLAQRIERASRETKSRRLIVIIAVVALAVLGAGYVSFGTGVQVVIYPEEARAAAVVELTKGIGFTSGNRVVAMPGDVILSVGSRGYETQDVALKPTAGGNIQEVTLEKSPDVVTVTLSPPLSNAEIYVDEILVGNGPSTSFVLRPGSYGLKVTHPAHKEYVQDLHMEGGGNEHQITVRLDPATQGLLVMTEPEGASVYVDNAYVDITPIRIDLLRGNREIRLELEGYVPETRMASVSLERLPEIGVVRMRRIPGELQIRSDPTQASVLIDGEFRGSTPLTTELAPDRPHRVSISYPGYRTATESILLESGQENSINVNLEQVFGLVEVMSNPDASVYVDGQRIGETPIELSLNTVNHEIELRRDGYQSWFGTVLPDPNIEKSVDVNLLTRMEALVNSAERFFTNSINQNFILVEPGYVEMGAPRSEPGQRANEVPRQVEITRHFYIGINEVTALEFASFAEDYGLTWSGKGTQEPVVNISWEDAARYSNWLSQKESLRPVYQFANDSYIGFDLDANGYRLPTEAEWVWVARYEGGNVRGALRFPWGNSMPVPPNTGNFADESAIGLVDKYVSRYDDGVATLARVGSYTPNGIGVTDMGGNVSEWTHDFYELVALSSPGIERDRVGPARGQQHVIRGSSWRSSTLTELRYAYRAAGSGPRDDVGFRLARWLGGRNGE